MVHEYYGIFKKTKVNPYVVSFSERYQAYPVIGEKMRIRTICILWSVCIHTHIYMFRLHKNSRS